MDEDQILRKIVETYCEFLVAFTRDDDGISVDEKRKRMRKEIESHKEWVAEQRRIFEKRMNEIDQNPKTEDDYKVLNIKFHCTSFNLLYKQCLRSCITQQKYFLNIHRMVIAIVDIRVYSLFSLSYQMMYGHIRHVQSIVYEKLIE